MTLLGKILAILNALAAAGFAYLALKDHSTRQAWAYQVQRSDRAIHGQPLQDQYVSPGLPRDRYLADHPDAKDSQGLQDDFKVGGAPGQPVPTQKEEIDALMNPAGGKSFFAAVNQAAKEAGGNAPTRAKVQGVLFPLAASGARLAEYEKAIKGAERARKLGALLEDAARRYMLAQALLPLEELHDGGHRELLLARIGDLKTPYKDLEKLLQQRMAEVVQAREGAPVLDAKNPKKKGAASGALVFDILSLKRDESKKNAKFGGVILVRDARHRVRYLRSAKDQKVTIWLLDAQGNKEVPADANGAVLKLTNVEGEPEFPLGKEGNALVAKNQALKTDQVLTGQITLTLAGKPEYCQFSEREPLEQREAIAYLLLTLSQVARPDGKPLDTPSEKRVEVIVGRRRYNQAMELLASVFRQVTQRRIAEAEYDLESFAEKYNHEVQERLPYLINAIARHQTSVDDWKKRKKEADEQLDAREAYYKEILKQLKAERKKATEALAELAKWQRRLFLAQKKGSGVGEENQRLERKIRQLERGR